jgi:ABC-type transport system involved in cytochrome bd biosynthesis fused ATPase/permease subunit
LSRSVATTQPVLNNFNLRAREGEAIALLGSTGSARRRQPAAALL